MTKYVHIVQVHPVENGEPNLHKVELEYEFADKAVAIQWMQNWNDNEFVNTAKAVYYGRVNDATGELE